jgi:glycosyltransferase involved in cell wall biosynthesis
MKSEYKHDVIWARGKEVKSKAQDLGQSQVFTLTYDAMPSMIADSSYGIAICKNNLGPSLSAAMPTKIAEFLSVGRPVVVNSDLGDVERLLIDKGVAVPLNNVTGITKAAKKLIGLLEDPHTPARCRIIAEEALSLKSATDAYTSLYRAMLRKH